MSKRKKDESLKDYYFINAEAFLNTIDPAIVENAENILILGNIGNIICKKGGERRSILPLGSRAAKTQLLLFKRIKENKKRTVFVVSRSLRREIGRYLEKALGIRCVDDLWNTSFYTACFEQGKNFSENFIAGEKNVKFDLILANPPFDFGNEITAYIVKTLKFDQYINLMPVAKYGKNNLYKHVKEIESLSVDSFEDASVYPKVAVLSEKSFREESWEEFSINAYDERFEKFYRENLSRIPNFEYVYTACSNSSKLKCEEILSTRNTDIDFLITVRTAENGVHTTQNCADYKWNIEKSSTYKDIPIYYNKMKNGPGFYHPSVGFIHFNAPEEHKNFCDYWYTANLSEKLIKGLHKQSGGIEDAIPRVDWSRSWTDEEILIEFGYNEEEIKEILK